MARSSVVSSHFLIPSTSVSLVLRNNNGRQFGSKGVIAHAWDPNEILGDPRKLQSQESNWNPWVAQAPPKTAMLRNLGQPQRSTLPLPSAPVRTDFFSGTIEYHLIQLA